MQLDVTEEQGILRDSLRRFLQEEYSFAQRQQRATSAQGFSEPIWRAFAKQGVLGVALPEEHGGWGGSVELMIVMEEIGRFLVLEPFMSTVVLGGGLIRELGTPEQKEACLPGVIRGDVRIALAHGERDSRYAIDHVQTIVRRRNGESMLEGCKTVTLDAPLSDWLIVSARHESSGELALYLIERATPGITCTAYRTQDDRTAAHVRFEGVRVTEQQRLGASDSVASVLERMIGCAIAGLCAEAVGAMEAVNELTRAYLGSRRQFGQPIGKFQALQHRLADMYVWATQARSMSLLATVRCNDPDVALRRRSVASAKALIGRAGRFIGQQAVQLHGGMGIAAECAVGHYFKRLTVVDALYGNSDHHVAFVSDCILAEDVPISTPVSGSQPASHRTP